MPAIRIDTCYLKEILQNLPEMPSHNWLISGLECYDYCGWDGCEKWAEYDLFLTDEELKHDVNLRNMQIIWGVFSAIPAEYTKEEIDVHPHPMVETTGYMRNYITPQHPLALLEFWICDGCYIIANAWRAELLQPFYGLPFEVWDEEKRNCEMNAVLCKIQDRIKKLYPEIDVRQTNEIQWKCWHALYRGQKNSVSEKALEQKIRKVYRMMQTPGYNYRSSIWDPYLQK